MFQSYLQQPYGYYPQQQFQQMTPQIMVAPNMGYVSVYYGDIDNGKILTNSIIYTNDFGGKLPKHYLINFGRENNNQRDYRKYSRPIFRSDTLDSIRDKCRLFREFENGDRWLYHQELTGIGMNIIHVDTGIKVFLDIRSQHTEYPSYVDKPWDYYLDYFKRREYCGMKCDLFCPYADECQHGYNILETAKIKYRQIIKLNDFEEKYYSLEVAVQDLNDQFAAALSAPDNRIHVIKAQTAIGKTFTYLMFVKQSDRPCLIAVPTNKLKHEVLERARAAGINMMETPSLTELIETSKDILPPDVFSNIRSMQKSGRHKQITPYIADVAKEHKLLYLLDYLEKKAAIKEFDGHIITTHQYLLRQSYDFLKKYNIIVDEDIMKTILQNHTEVSINELEDTLEENPQMDFSYRDKIEQVIHSAETKGHFTTKRMGCYENIEASFDLPALMNAEHFYSDDDSIYFFKQSELQKLKYIVVSATANDDIYKYYFGSQRIKFHNCKKAKYKGKLVQHYDETYSRSCIRANKEADNDIYQKVKSMLGDDIPIISFKGQVAGETIHYGNSEGCDFLAGRDIAVVGTPHVPNHIYELFARQRGFTVRDSDKLYHQEITHNGFKFWFMTYKNEMLRNIQLWIIGSELEQSVGRARLLRKDCTVTLFSNFPLTQADLKTNIK